ncbi:hypothetical protein PEC18_39565 [Paucibacter sp. O1-1]|nr:hypothetical protein [Paucibacter sp. O1-1]MDA3831709.1 hypothetical protein [Paucibacter sp. O1-1]
MSLTGSNADYRTAVKLPQLGLVVTALYNKVAAKLGGKSITASAIEVANPDKAAAELVAAKGQALVVCGNNDPSPPLWLTRCSVCLEATDQPLISTILFISVKEMTSQ